ncbi:WAT1-related protein At1g68170-like [Juglans microcarpa x Juglans regia]|uniref:WAT1-related protein At1g68170-like n=1 Tax=Juglans microcarpa x Juglans regia TaxID=2249226 RepID=UPI001B7ED161|nr:WAT1-related protein At1g68170-like [Juglans microcarpa x Juglans regia]
MMEKYPCHYSSTALMCVMGAIQSVVFALCLERDWSQWKLGWNIRLLTVAYSVYYIQLIIFDTCMDICTCMQGIFGSGVVVTLLTWCLHMRGPLYVSSFNPLMPVSVAIMGSLLLDEKLHLGSIIGAMMIVFGLYSVLWGKYKEMIMKKNMVISTSHA